MPTLADVLRGYTPPTESALADPITAHLKSLPQKFAQNQQNQMDLLSQAFPGNTYESMMTQGDPKALAELGMQVPLVGQTVFHGANAENINKIKELGFIPKKGIGISSQPNEEFVFVTPSKNAAKYYAESNIRNKNPQILQADLEGKLLDLPKSLHEHEAFGEASKLLGLPTNEKGYYSLPEIKQALQEQGYVGISYKDRSANNRKAFAVLPDYVKPSISNRKELIEEQVNKLKD